MYWGGGVNVLKKELVVKPHFRQDGIEVFSEPKGPQTREHPG